jgi:hypothetical protein
MQSTLRTYAFGVILLSLALQTEKLKRILWMLFAINYTTT